MMGFQNLTGTTLGRYELHELLGAGGMAAVYRGYQANLKRYVAVKVIYGEMARQSGYLERFNREAETSAKLEHPNIVHIVDYGVEQGHSYLVMQLLTGGTLAERIDRHIDAERPLPSLGEIAKMLRQVGSALDYAHSEGVIHRDIKPSNVMFDNHGNACLVDFGIAKMAAEVSELTPSGVVVGTVSYVAPEQWQGEDPIPVTDQYALGVMTYQLLTGQLPFTAPTTHGVIQLHLNAMPVPVHVHRPDLPEALTHIIEHALAKNPYERFETCTSFAQTFEAAIRGGAEPTQGYVAAPFGGHTKPMSASIAYTPARAPDQDVIALVHESAEARTLSGRAVDEDANALEDELAEDEVTSGRVRTHRESTPVMWLVPVVISGLLCAGIAYLAAGQLWGGASEPDSLNDDWTPVVQEFDGVAMVMVPAGCFEMGSHEGVANEGPAHEVCFEEPFWIDRYEVTNGQFAMFDGQAVNRSRWNEASRPRVGITWYEAQTFCESRGARLPYEAEWEYAARGPDALIYPWGNEFEGDNVVWGGNSGGQTANVGNIQDGSSWVGAFDLSGNVWEWVADWYSADYYATLTGGVVNPRGPATGMYRVVRGGAWVNGSADFFRAVYRNWNAPEFSFDYYGFRCARSGDS